MRIATWILLVVFVGVSLLMDRYYDSLSDYAYWCLLQLTMTIVWVLIVLWTHGWAKVVSFAILSLTYVELFQQIVNGNTKTTIKDDVALVAAVVSVAVFIFLRRYKRIA